MHRVALPSMILLMVFAFGTVTAQAEVVTIDGTINSVDSKKRTITVESGAQTLTLDLSSKAKISVEGKDANLDSLRPGQKIKLSYHKELEIVLKLDVAPSESSDQGGMISLFDGQSLKGWHGNPKHWKVVNGAIVGRLKPPVAGGSFLTYEKQFGDFELRLKFKIVAGNSGVQIRSKQHANYIVTGPQADIVFNNFKWTGVLVGGPPQLIAMTDQRTQEVLRKTLKQGDWNDMTIVAKGSSVRIDVNDITTVAAVDADIPASGILAFQLDDRDPTVVMFKDIKLRRLESVQVEKQLSIAPP